MKIVTATGALVAPAPLTVEPMPLAAGIAGAPIDATGATLDTVIDPSTVDDGIEPSGTVRPGRQDPATLEKAVENVLAADGRARVGVDRTTNAATFLSGEFGVLVKPGVGGSGPDKLARTFLVQHGALFGLDDHGSQLELLSVEKDRLGYRHYRYQQVHRGLPVFGQQLIVHAQGERVTSVNGRITPNIVDAEPRLAGADAASSAMQLARRELGRAAAPTDAMRAYGAQKLGWYTLANGTPRLAYEVVVGSREDHRWQMYVDATSGKVLDKWSLVHSALSRETIDAKTGKVRKEADGPTGDEVLDIAHDHAGSVYDYFKQEHARDSIDGRGMKLKSVVHYGNKYNNAFWNGSQMTYGDGDGVRFRPLGLGIDVVGHEMSHGVTERTAGLRYQRQSGALNESWSDVFGNVIEKWVEHRDGVDERDPAWFIGEEIFTPGVDGDGLRSMSRPGTAHDKDPQPDHMGKYKETNSDNGGVHINSGIPNKAAYEVANQLGIQKLGDIWFRALTTYLTNSSQFVDAANVTVQSAIDLYGSGSDEAKAVASAWTSVGLPPSLDPGAGS